MATFIQGMTFGFILAIALMLILHQGSGLLRGYNGNGNDGSSETVGHFTKVTSSIRANPMRYVGDAIGKIKTAVAEELEQLTTVEVAEPAPSNGEKLSRSYCQAKYGSKSYLPENQRRLPPMFYTFPGSGNTWCRLLIEHATGILTGSVYNDQSLLEALPGEFTCNWRVSVVKVHPHTHSFSELHSGRFNSDNGKCKKGGVDGFQRAVLLIRNPFDSIWSEYQRRVTQSHVEGILKRDFDWSRWQANAASLSSRYYEMWEWHYKSIERSFAPSDILYIRYEDLRDKSKRVEVLGEVAKFLRMETSTERLECSFILSENTQAHRSVSDQDMTKDEAYTRELACRMWNKFGSYIESHGYGPWKGYNCSGYPKIPDINVGPRGEYNRQWVSPGQKLIDFGGHAPSTFKGDKIGSGAKRAGGKGGKVGKGGGIKQGLRMKNQQHQQSGGDVDRSSNEGKSHLEGLGSLGENKPAWA